MNDSYKLYHKDVGFPHHIRKTITLAKTYNWRFKPVYTPYVLKRAATDIRGRRKGGIILPEELNINSCTVIEVGVAKDGKIAKMVLRTEYDHEDDLIIVILTRCLTVKTVYLNRRSDDHVTLDRSKYDLP